MNEGTNQDKSIMKIIVYVKKSTESSPTVSELVIIFRESLGVSLPG